MKTFLHSLSFSLALLLASLTSSARAQDDSSNFTDDQTGATANSPPQASAPATNDGSVSFQQFYNELANQGTWIDTNQYGYVFQPTESSPDWAPYTYGHWVNTDAGMTWVSDDSFGWATDHYGRWTNLDGYGWVWVPGYTWAPAWVSWREGDDEVGWAPLPPDTDLGIDYYGDDDDGDFGYHIGDDCDLAYGIGPWWYNFCPIAYIGDRDCWHHFHHRGDNFGLIGRTRNLTNLNFTRNSVNGRFGHVTAGGPSVASLNARAQTPIQSVRLARASTLDSAGLRGDTLSVFAPRVNPATRSTARPDVVARTIANTTVNHGTDINHGLAVNSHLAAPAATAAQMHAAEDARNTTSFANARVPTDSTHFTRGFTGSFNALTTEPHANTAFNAGTVRSPLVSRVTSETAASGFEPARSASAFTGGSSARVFDPSRTTRVFDNYPAASEFRASQGAPMFHSYSPAYRSYTPSYHSSAPSYRSYGGSSFHSYAAPRYSSGGYSHAASGGFSGSRGGSYSGGGGHVGGGAFSVGGGRR